MKWKKRPVRYSSNGSKSKGGFSWWVLAPFGIFIAAGLFYFSGFFSPWATFTVRAALSTVAMLIVAYIGVSNLGMVRKLFTTRKDIGTALLTDGLLTLVYICALWLVGGYWLSYAADVQSWMTSEYASITGTVKEIAYHDRTGGRYSLDRSYSYLTVGSETFRFQKHFDVALHEQATVYFLPHSKMVIDIVKP